MKNDKGYAYTGERIDTLETEVAALKVLVAHLQNTIDDVFEFVVSDEAKEDVRTQAPGHGDATAKPPVYGGSYD